MNYLQTFRGWTGVLVALLGLTLPACTLFQTKVDPKVVGMQRELRRISKSEAQTAKALQEIHYRLDALETRVARIGNTVEELQSRPAPVLITPSKPPSTPQVAKKAPIPKETTKPPATPKQVAQQTVKKKSAAKKRKSTRPSTSSPRKKYDKAYAAYTANRYDEALASFKGFLKQYPQHHLADNAQYWVGEIYYDIENFPSSILAFKEVVTRYGNENKAPDALLKIGYAYVAMDDPNNARIFLKRVIKNYPFSEAEAKARAKLKELENL